MHGNTTEILLSSVSSGKTESVINRLIQTLDQKPFTAIWILLASRRQEDAFRERLSTSGRRVFFNVEFFNFYSLYQHILNIAGKSQMEINEPARHALLRAIIANLQPQLEVFNTITHTQGFIHIIADFIDELKQNKIFPEEYIATCKTARDRDLALIYHSYQDYMQQWGLMDKEGEGWLALETLETLPSLGSNIDLLLVDGFDHFTDVQANLLGLLTNRINHSLITLTTVPKREKTIGRRFVEALDQLKKYLQAGTFSIRELAYSGSRDRSADLQFLVDNIFLYDVNPIASIGNITLIEAPDPAIEVGAVLRHVKRLLLEDETSSPDDILIAVRDWERYRPHFVSLSRKYQLPLVLHYGMPLVESPAIIAILNLLHLHVNEFSRHNLFDVLQSPYFSISISHYLPMLDEISRVYNIIGGREDWLSAIERDHFEQRIDDERRRPLAGMSQDDLEIFHNHMEAFFDLVTPPHKANVYEYVTWLENLIGSDEYSDPDDEMFDGLSSLALNMIDRIRQNIAQDYIVMRDMVAMKAFKQGLRGVLDSEELVDSLTQGHDREIDWDAFMANLSVAIGAMTINPHQGRFGHVLVTTAANARGLPHDHVYILGLSEGIFPVNISEDPLYLDSERVQLEFNNPLETNLEQQSDDGLFYELICLPHRSLVFSRPTVNDGQVWVESPLWRAVKNVFSDADELILKNRFRVGEVVPYTDVASYEEAVVSLAEELVQGNKASLGAQCWFNDTYPAEWARISTNRQIELNRMFSYTYDNYSGALKDNQLVDYVSDKLGASYIWSATQLNDYGHCGFRFFAKRLLKLETLKEPETGMDVAQRGTLNHEILERTYEELKRQNIVVDEDNVEVAKSILSEMAVSVFQSAPEKIGFRESALWEHEQAIILRNLMRIVELDFTGYPLEKLFGKGARKPYLLEKGFQTSIDLGEEIGPITVIGFIDRIDEQDGRAIVIDYKSGSTTIPVKELEEGRNFQMMVYLHGAQELLKQDDLNVAGGVFWHLVNGKTSGGIQLDDSEAVLNIAKEHLAHYIGAARRGKFPVHANNATQNGRCSQYCEFSELCRMSITNSNEL